MIRHRWIIPAALGTACLAMGAVSTVTSKQVEVKKVAEDFGNGQTHTWTGLDLQEGRKYSLNLVPVNGVEVGHTIVVGAALAAGDATVFEVEDAYWHERGVWREGGESGSWDEQNSSTAFTFAVPESGKYDLEVTLFESNTMGARIGVAVVWLDHFPLAAWPLLLGGVILFGLAGVAHNNGRTVMGKFLEELGPGSRLAIGGTEWTIIERSEQWELGERIGIEFRLRDGQGMSRYLSVDRFEREHPWAEDTDQILTQILFEVPLTPVQSAELATLPARELHVPLGDALFTLDKENSGHGMVVSVRNGDVYTSRFHSDVYRDEIRFPRAPGERWLERVVWTDNGDVEWSLMEIVDWAQIDVLEVVQAEFFDGDPVAASRPAQDPFGATPAATDFFGGAPPGKAEQHQRQQQWQADQARQRQSQHQPGQQRPSQQPGASQQDQQQPQTQSHGIDVDWKPGSDD